jgi:creatinine amidohydrolase
MSDVLEWARLTWPEAEAAVSETPACILPFGAVEAHGPHLPLQADTLLTTEECRRVCERTGVILLPTVPYGQVWSLYSFPGTLSVSIYTLIALTKDLVRSLRDHGFRLVLIHSGHLGNIAGLKQAIRECHDELRGVKVVLLDCLPGAIAQVESPLTTRRSHPSLIHSCEIETSMVLEVAADEVHMERAVREYPDYPYDFDLTPTPWRAVTTSGVLGDATAATADKGRALVAAEVDAMVSVIEQELAALRSEPASADPGVDR